MYIYAIYAYIYAIYLKKNLFGKTVVLNMLLYITCVIQRKFSYNMISYANTYNV